MSAETFSLDAFLSDSPVELDSGSGSIAEGDVGVSPGNWQEPDYTGQTDYRIRQLSYSSLLTLHSCPRKFQLQKLRTTNRIAESLKSTITFSYGHVVGEGIASALSGASESQVIFGMFLGWHTPSLFDEDEKLNKSLWSAIIAIKRFFVLRDAVLRDYELVYYQDKPATELSFAISFPDGYRLRGFVDAVLRHRVSGEILVLECKTTGSRAVNPTTYKNSAQAIGYSVVLDHLFPSLSSYKVLYLVYSTTAGEYFPIPSVKTYLQRALWIRELLLDIETIKMYDAAEIYPMRGESCMNFGRECEYINSCSLSTANLTKPCTADMEDKTDYQVQITLVDLLESQLSKISVPVNDIVTTEDEML